MDSEGVDSSWLESTDGDDTADGELLDGAPIDGDRHCEVCTEPSKPGERSRRRVLVGDRIVALCEAHAVMVLEAGVENLGQLRRLFAESEGHRSRVDRRSPLDRRVLPPRPEGRRRGLGRRTDEPG